MNYGLERATRSVAEQIADLLNTRVEVADERGTILTTCLPHRRSHQLSLTEHARVAPYLRVPLTVGGEQGELIVGQPANGETMSPGVARVLLELMVNQSLVQAQLQNQHELKNTFIHDLLRGILCDEGAILREGQILGMDFTPPRAVILIDAADYILDPGQRSCSTSRETRIRRYAQAVVRCVVEFFHLPSETICAHIGDGTVAVLKASSTQDLVPWADLANDGTAANPSWANLNALKRAGNALFTRLRAETDSTISVGIGRYHPSVLGLARSYEDARAALALGRRFHGENRVHCLDTLGVAALVGVQDEETKLGLARHLLSPLDEEPELLDTLERFFDHNCAPSETAAALSIHRNTLGYRLDKIASLSGLDARHFDDAVQIRLALLLRSLHGVDADCATAQSRVPQRSA
jgi:carbohydrate diacid regulator